MSKKVLLDINDVPVSLFDTDINSSIPAEAIDITHDQWLEIIANSGKRKWNSTTSSLEVYDEPIDVNQYKENNKYYIDGIAEEQRLKYITGGSGQALTYQEKADESTDYIANGSPADLSSYPFIQAEVNATGKTPTDAANDILTSQSVWINKGALIEEHRLSGKISIDNATTTNEIDTIVSTTISNIQGV